MKNSQIVRNLTLLSDAGHGWLSVSHADVRNLGLMLQISPASYVSGSRVYLEEDLDAPRFLAAARERGWRVNVKEKTCDSDYSWIRNLPPYNSDYLTFPLVLGSPVSLVNGQTGIIVQTSRKNRFAVLSSTGVLYTVPKTNPFRYMVPTGVSGPVKVDRNPSFPK